MHDFIDVMLLSVLQGVAEFLPISSSGHLVIAQNLLGINAPGMRLEIILHLGTLVSVVAFYRIVIWRLVKGFFHFERESLCQIGCIVLSAVPAGLFYALCKDTLDRVDESTRAVGFLLMFTGVVLLLLKWLSYGEGKMTWPKALVTGIAQAIAVLPGVSRSGMTIAAARMQGVAPERAAEFSFLMLLPVLIGSALLDAAGLTSAPGAANPIPGWMLWSGAAVSAIVGYLSLAILVKTLKGSHFWVFGIYCLLAGLLTVCFIK
jgi:undecaprenyl-diphosphatase